MTLMVEIFLMWVLVGGSVKDVDAFVTQQACESAHEQAAQMVDMAKLQRPELANLSVSPCVSVSVPNPPPPTKETI